ANARVYRQAQHLKSATQPPTPVSWLDKVFRARAQAAPQPHVWAADRWLGLRWGGDPSTNPPDPAHCYMALREARTALSRNPDDTNAFRLLNHAYRFLIQREAVLIGQ